MSINKILLNEHFNSLVYCSSSEEMPINNIYCGDLLSWVMVHIPKESAWCTIMGHVNTIAVAQLCQVPLIILCENAKLNIDAQHIAEQQKISVIQTQLPTFDAACCIKNILHIV